MACMTCTNVNISVVCRNICQHFILMTGPNKAHFPAVRWRNRGRIVRAAKIENCFSVLMCKTMEKVTQQIFYILLRYIKLIMFDRYWTRQKVLGQSCGYVYSTCISSPSCADWTTVEPMLVNRCFRTDSQLLQHTVCLHQHDKWTASCHVMWICVQGLTAGQWQHPYDCPADLYSRPWLGSASDDIHRLVLSGTCPQIHGYLKKNALSCALKVSLASKFEQNKACCWAWKSSAC